MKYLTSQDTEIPALGLGTWKSRKGDVYGAVREALHIGYRHVDCAPAYENEEEVGAALKEMISSGNISRDSVWVTSKLWNNGHHPSDVEDRLQKTLSDLQLDYLDLYLIHWPVLFRSDIFFPRSGKDFLPPDEIPHGDTWNALEKCVEKGLVRKIGVCNYSVNRLEDLMKDASLPPFMNQIELHPFLQQPDMVSFCSKNHILLTAYSPLGSIDRPSRLKKTDEPALLEHPEISRIAASRKITPAQVLLAWALQRETIVIPKSVNSGRLKENFDSLEISLDKDEMEQIAQLDEGFRYVDGKFWEVPGSGYSASEIWDEK